MMGEYVYLIGAEDVSRAASSMREAQGLWNWPTPETEGLL